MNKPDSQRLTAFHDLLIQLQKVERFTLYPYDTSKRENDVEHSYFLAMAVWMLAPHFDLDADKAIKIALTHDLIEVHSGDTFVFGEQANIDTKAQRERDALDRIKNDWPDFPAMIESIEDYEHKASAEARFVYALDKVMPIIMNILGKGYGWRKNKITLERFIAEKEAKIAKDSPIYDYYQEILSMLRENPGYFYQENPSQQG